MPARPSGKGNSLSLDRTPTPYPATADDRDKPPFFARLFSSKKPTHHKSAGHVPASELPPASSSSAAPTEGESSASASTSQSLPKPTKLKFGRTLSMPRLARTPTPYPEPQTSPKRKLSLSSLFGSKPSDETPAGSSSTPSTLPRRAQKRLAKLNLIRAPTPYPEQAHHSKPKSWWSAKKKQTITRDGARPQIVVLRKEPMRKVQSSMYVDGEAGSSRGQESESAAQGGQRHGASTPVLNTDATVEIVDGASKPVEPANANSLASASVLSSANTTPRAKLISFPSEPTINPNAASSSSASAAAVARSKSTPNRRIHILEPDLEGVSRKSSRRPTEAKQTTAEAEPATTTTTATTTSTRATTTTPATTGTSDAEPEAKTEASAMLDTPSDSTPTPLPADLAARGITIVEGSTQILPLPPHCPNFSPHLMVAVWLTTWVPLCAHLSLFAPSIYYTVSTPPTIRASMLSSSTHPSSYHFSASDTDSDDMYSELGYPLDIGTLHAFLMHSSGAQLSAAARGAARLKRPRRRAMKRLGKGSHLLRISTKPVKWFAGRSRTANMEADIAEQPQAQQAFRAPLVVTTHAAKTGQVPLTVRGKHPRLPIPSVFYDETVMGRRVELPEVGDWPPLPPLGEPAGPSVGEVAVAVGKDAEAEMGPYSSRACLDAVDPEIRAAFDDLMVDLTRHPSVKLADPTTPPLRSVGSFAELAKKLTDRTRALHEEGKEDATRPARHIRAPPPPPIPTDEVNLHFANLTPPPDRDMVSPRSTHSSIRRRKPRPSSGISESTDWSGTGSSAAPPTNASRTSSRAPTMDSGYFPGSPPTLTSSSSTTGSTSFSSTGTATAAAPGSPTCSIPPVPMVPAWILANPSIFPPGPGSDMGSCSIATDIRPDSPDVRVEYAFHTDYANWVHHWKDLVKDTTFDQALQIGFRMPAGALGVKQVVTMGVAKKRTDEEHGSRRSSISMLRRFSNVSLASMSHAIRHPVDTVLGHGHDSPQGSLTPASSNASLRSSVFGGGSGSGYHPSARPSIDGASSVASTVKSRKSLLERLRFGSIASRRSSFLMSGAAAPVATTPIQETDESDWSTATAPPGPVDASNKSSKLSRKWSQKSKAARKRLSKVFGSFGFGGGQGEACAGTSSGDEVEVEEDEDNVPLAQVMKRASSSMLFTSLSRTSSTLTHQPPLSSSSVSMSLRGTLPRTTTGSMSLRAMYTAGPSAPAPAIASTASGPLALAHGTSTAAALAHLTMHATGSTTSEFGGRGSAMEPFSDDDSQQQVPLTATSTLERAGRTSAFIPPPPKLARSLSRATHRTRTPKRTGSIGAPTTPKSAYFPSNVSMSAVSLASSGTHKTMADGPHEIRRSVVLTEDVDVWTIRISLTPNVCS